MTDRAHSLTVVLNRNTRVDDLQPLMNAIEMFEGVLEVKANIADPASYVAEARAWHDVRERVWQALRRDGEA